MQGETMANTDSHVTIHMAASLDGFIARKDGSVDWLETSDECLRLGLADEVRYSILPILIGDGIPFFEKLDRDIALHLAEVKAYKSGMVELRYVALDRAGMTFETSRSVQPARQVNVAVNRTKRGVCYEAIRRQDCTSYGRN
jgi:hypothetical protein